MRVAIVTESFLPQVNGVTGSVQKLLEHLGRRGHSALVIAPGPGPTTWAGADVVRTPSLPLPGYGSYRVGTPWPQLSQTLQQFDADLLHLASPTVLGAQAITAATRLGLPSIAVYQTDLAAFAARYRIGGTSPAVWRWLRWIHRQADLTLAPSRQAALALAEHGIPRVRLWPRGVDGDLFAPYRRDDALRRELAPDGERLVGYVGRLAAEKQVHLLAGLHGVPGVQLVIVGDGPVRPALEALLPRARFLGVQRGERLASLFASLDLFVHTGAHETFCQAAQEALASGVPVVAPAAGGLLDLVQDGVNGRLYAPGSATALRDAALPLLQDPASVATMAGAARGTVAARTWQAVGDSYLRHAWAVLDPRSAALVG